MKRIHLFFGQYDAACEYALRNNIDADDWSFIGHLTQIFGYKNPLLAYFGAYEARKYEVYKYAHKYFADLV